MNSPKSGYGCLSIIGITSILFAGGWYINHQGWLGKKLIPIEGAKVIPQEAIVTSFISTEAKSWSQLEQLSSLATESIIQEFKEDLKQEFPESTAINYQQDIQPWIGGIMMAVLPDQKATQEDANILLVLGIKSKLKARKFLKKIQKETQQDWQKSKYKGVAITVGKTKDNSAINSALLGNKLVLSDHLETVKQAIDTYKGEPSLASEPEAKEILSQQLKLDNPLAQIYLTNFNYLLAEIAEQEIPASTLEQWQQLESVVVGVGTAEKALRIQSVTNLKSQNSNYNTSPNKSSILNKLPDNTIAVVNGQQLNEIWSTTVKLLETEDDFRNGLNMGRLSFRLATQLDLDQDIFSWMDGEFAIGLIATEKPIIPELEVELEPVIIVETSKSQKAKSTLTQIEKSLQNHAGIEPKQRKVAKKQTFTEWSTPQSDFSLAYGWLDQKYLVFTVGNSFLGSKHKSGNNSLNQSKKFKAIAQKLPKKNMGYFYLDINHTMSMIQKKPTDTIDISPEQMAFLNSLQGIGATATMQDQLTSQLDILVLFE